TATSEHAGAKEGLAFIIMLNLLFLFMTTTVGLAYGVVEEKGSRIVEILLVAVKPWQLLTGKLLAFGVIGALQLAAFAVSGLGTAKAIGVTEELPPGMVGVVGATFAGYILGYLCFGAMAAALGSLVSRQEETNGALTPMTLATVLSYLGAYIAYSQPDTARSEERRVGKECRARWQRYRDKQMIVNENRKQTNPNDRLEKAEDE